jgi:hypothetical protein
MKINDYVKIDDGNHRWDGCQGQIISQEKAEEAYCTVRILLNGAPIGLSYPETRVREDALLPVQGAWNESERHWL